MKVLSSSMKVTLSFLLESFDLNNFELDNLEEKKKQNWIISKWNHFT